MRRRKAREFALQILFALENQYRDDLSAAKDGVQKAVSEYLQNFGPRDFEENSDIPHLQRLLQSILGDVAEIDASLEQHSEHWKLYRMTKIDRNILRIGAAELRSFQDVPAKVIIDECVELAKRFGTDESSAFVNGLLDNLRRALGRDET